jgi:hydroxymethylpyrimidine pyrophosphatase-like HAD family hydrolase
MKLFALALDYDGTIASNDTLDPLVRDAIAAARSSGIAVLLATAASLMSCAVLPAICSSSTR